MATLLADTDRPRVDEGELALRGGGVRVRASADAEKWFICGGEPLAYHPKMGR